MGTSKADLIIHPVRLRIMQTLVDGPKTTSEISEGLPDVPTSSIYRHLKLLLDGKMIEVAEVNIVQGIVERVYKLIQVPRLTSEDMSEVSADEHLRYFVSYIITLIQGFEEYITSVDRPDFERDMAGFTETTIWATEEELRVFVSSLNEAIAPLAQHSRDERRRKRKIAVILHPIVSTRSKHERERS